MKYSLFEPQEILKKVKVCVKAVARVPLLVIALLLSSFFAPATNAAPAKKSINERVGLVRDTLKRNASQAQTPSNNLSYSERLLSQWGNWGNWGNWNNWVNWNNWNNWRNWGNWGNWGNF
jgi:hypothetical protein